MLLDECLATFSHQSVVLLLNNISLIALHDMEILVRSCRGFGLTLYYNIVIYYDCCIIRL